MNAVDPHLARYDVAELREMARMAQDVIDEDGPFSAQAVEWLAEYEAVIAAKSGITQHPVEDDVTVGRQGGSPAANQYGVFSVHHASEKQVAFLARLIAEKNTDGVKVPTTLEGISKTAASALIDKLIDRPAKSGAVASAPGFRAASEKQVALLNKLCGEKDWAGVVDGVPFDIDTNNPTWISGLSIGQASKVIDTLFSAPRKRVAEVELAAGAYRVGEKIIRVYLGQQSGKMLAAELVDITAEDRDDAWAYLGMATRFVPADAHRLTVEECEAIAGASGQSFSWCCVCGRRLDDPNSVSRGIGPICRAKQGM